MASIYTYNPTTTRFRVRPYTTEAQFFNAGFSPSSNPAITINTCPGEYVPAGFVVRSTSLLTNFLPQASDLSDGQGHTIPASDIDLCIVKCWYQWGDNIETTFNYDIYGWNPPPSGECPRPVGSAAKCLLPELLIHDDSYDASGNYTGFMRVDIISQSNGDNYLRVFNPYPTPTYQNVSHTSPGSQVQWDVRDSDTLSSTRFGEIVTNPDSTTYQNYNKQYWMTIHPSADVPAGTYTGTITLTSNQGNQGVISLTVVILPFILPVQSTLFQGFGYSNTYGTGTLYLGGGSKSYANLLGDALDMRKHGVLNAFTGNWSGQGTGYQTAVSQILNARQYAGFDMSRIIIQLEYPDYTDLALLANQVAGMRDWLHDNYQTTEVYFFSMNYDEDPLTGLVNQIATIRAQSTTYCTCGIYQWSGPSDAMQNYNNGNPLVDIVCLHGSQVGQDTARRNVISSYHSKGKEVLQYSNPQAGAEEALLWRRNFGLYMWQYGYDGCFNFTYQYPIRNLWNDWDWASSSYKQHVMAYPLTVTGSGVNTKSVIDTVHWDGQREGFNDLRYLRKLQDTIDLSPSSPEKTAAQNYIASLQTLDLRPPTDLEAIRQTIITHTLNLIEEPQPPCPPGIDDCASFTINISLPAGDILENTVTYDQSVPSNTTVEINYQIKNTGDTGTVWTGLYDKSDPPNLIQGQYWQGMINAGATMSVSLTVNITESVGYQILVGHQE